MNEYCVGDFGTFGEHNCVPRDKALIPLVKLHLAFFVIQVVKPNEVSDEFGTVNSSDCFFFCCFGAKLA